jgi:large conductance mechanosensitive channel
MGQDRARKRLSKLDVVGSSGIAGFVREREFRRLFHARSFEEQHVFATANPLWLRYPPVIFQLTVSKLAVFAIVRTLPVAGSQRQHAQPTRKWPMLKEFQEFISKGNVMDLAVGVIIGAAFGKIVDSLVNDIIMPIVGAIFGGLDFNNYFVGLSSSVTATSLAAAKEQGAVFAYGSFLTVVLNFLILAWIIFLMVKGVNNMRRRLEREKPAEPAAPPPADVALLTEIRDLLAKK